jgi:uroporphyrinogen-III synthase
MYSPRCWSDTAQLWFAARWSPYGTFQTLHLLWHGFQRFTSNFPDDFVLLTGEGLERLVGFARRADMEEVFITALTRVRKITRGPKPVRRLRALGLQTDLAAEPPTTAGIIASLSNEDLAGRRVAIQLYPDNPNLELLNFLHAAGANPDPVLC